MADSYIVLASASPRRAEILTSLGISFRIDPPVLEEVLDASETAEDAVSRLARAKGAEVAERHPREWVLSADTLVALDGRILGKPLDAADAIGMLRFLSGREHEVVTSVCLRRGADPGAEVRERSRVRISPLTEEEIAWYAGTGEPLDKAGAYAVQGLGARFVESVNGSYTNVMGLPARAVYRLMREAPDSALARLALSSP